LSVEYQECLADRYGGSGNSQRTEYKDSHLSVSADDLKGTFCSTELAAEEVSLICDRVMESWKNQSGQELTEYLMGERCNRATRGFGPFR
jgi:hypothetical protein